MADAKPAEKAAPATTETPEEEGLSRDAAHSTYAEAPAPKDAQNPPPGKQVEQTLGKPTES